MHALPEPTPTAPAAGQPAPDTLRRAAEVAAAVDAVYEKPTSFRDDSLPDAPTIGETPPVAQPDTRIVPQWATGIAVASIGIGAGVTGIGCGAWLIFQGLSSVTLLGAIAIATPFVGIAAVAMAVGAAISKAKRASTTNIYRGTVIQDQRHTTTHTRGVIATTRNQLPK